MGISTTLGSVQSKILHKITQDEFLTDTFYFSGGTALSEVYLQHRLSVDLDFFSFQQFDAQSVLSRLQSWSKELGFSIESLFVDPVNIYLLTFPNGETLKVDFAPYPYKQLEEPVLFIGKLKVDSKFDIAANKLLTITQRREIKDYVDLYFLMQEYTFWDLKPATEQKFKIIVEPFIIATDVMVVDSFENLPKMIKPLTLEELQTFFHSMAEKLGRGNVE